MIRIILTGGLLGFVAASMAAASLTTRGGLKSRKLADDAENIYYTNAELHVVFASVQSEMNTNVKGRFEQACEDFIYKNLRLPTFGMINFEVIVTAQALLEEERQQQRQLQEFLKRTQKDQTETFLALNTVVGIEYSHPDGETVDPSDFHRYLRLLVNARGDDLLLELKGTGESYFNSIHVVGTHSSTLKVDMIVAGTEELLERNVEPSSGLHPAALAGIAASTCIVVVGAAVLTMRKFLNQRNIDITVSSRDQTAPFTLEELKDFLGDVSNSTEIQKEQSMVTLEPHDASVNEAYRNRLHNASHDALSRNTEYDLEGAEMIIDELESSWGLVEEETEKGDSARKIGGDRGASTEVSQLPYEGIDEETSEQTKNFLENKHKDIDSLFPPHSDASLESMKAKQEKKMKKKQKKGKKGKDRKIGKEADQNPRVSLRSKGLVGAQTPTFQSIAQPLQSTKPSTKPSKAKDPGHTVARRQAQVAEHREKASGAYQAQVTSQQKRDSLLTYEDKPRFEPLATHSKAVLLQEHEAKVGGKERHQKDPPRPESIMAYSRKSSTKPTICTGPDSSPGAAIRKETTGSATKTKVSRNNEHDPLLLHTISTNLDEEDTLSSISESDTDSSSAESCY